MLHLYSDITLTALSSMSESRNEELMYKFYNVQGLLIAMFMFDGLVSIYREESPNMTNNCSIHLSWEKHTIVLQVESNRVNKIMNDLMTEWQNHLDVD